MALNRHTEPFFSLIRRTLANDIVIGVCRLTDKEQTKVKGQLASNLVLGFFVKKFAISDDTVLAHVARLETLRSSILPRRNKHAAHNDYEAILNPISIRSPKVQEMQSAVEILYEATQEIFDIQYQSRVREHDDPFGRLFRAQADWIEACLRMADLRNTKSFKAMHVEVCRRSKPRP
jgi:hypothetical protein